MQLDGAATAIARQKIHLALGQLYVGTGQYDQELEHLPVAYELAESNHDAAGKRAVCRWRARLHDLKGEYPQAFTWIEKGVADETQRQTAEYAQILLIAGLIHIRQGQQDEALTRCYTALEIAEQLGEVTALARAYNLLGIIALRSDSHEAIERFQQAFALYQQAGDVQGQATSHNLIANAYFNLGHWRKADFHYRQALRIFEQIGDIYNQAVAYNNLGGIAKNRGQSDEALTYYRDGLQLAEKIGGSAWKVGVLVPAIAANGGSATVTFDAPVGSSLSYIAWVNNTSVFDDFVAMHPPGNATTLSVPLCQRSTPVENVDFVIGAYDVNSTSPTDGSGTTCSPECPAPATGCFVAPGNASQGGGGTFPTPPTPNVRTFTASTSVGQNRLWWTNVGPYQGVAIARSASAVTWTPTNGVSYTAGQQVGAVAATGTVTTATRNQIADAGEMIDAGTALRFGLANRVTEAGGALAAALSLTELIAPQPAATVKIGKEAFYRQKEMPLDEAYAYAGGVMVENMLMREAEDGIGAFVGKRGG